jgi:peptide-methionine (S)-S-oxide reductase
MSNALNEATLGAGCFWCIEAVFQELKGVELVKSGYSGGLVMSPSYEQVATGTTGHAEVARITFDPSIISFKELLEVFWKTHDPTTLNRQGEDVGTQYRSAIFYHDDSQKKMAEHFMNELEKSGAFDTPIVTEISPLKKFYEAENYHNDYYKSNTSERYCEMVIAPKVAKFKKAFDDKLK